MDSLLWLVPNPNLLDTNLVVLTGAGISAESGLRTFRDEDGLWETNRFENHSPEELATPEAFARDPELVHRFYNTRRAQLKDSRVQPNAAHRALAELEARWRGSFLLITQNVDDLHERAGSKNIRAMHGELRKVRCLLCAHKFRWEEDLSTETPCPDCQQKNALRPDIVWFGEMPHHLEEIQNALFEADQFVAIGTSGVVYPAASFVRWADNAHSVEINQDDTPLTTSFNEFRRGPASVLVPQWVESLR